jgi:MFS transporter, OFA family, oxalate/formate antiporter
MEYKPGAALPGAPVSEFRRGWRVVLAAMAGVACGSSPIPFTSIGQLIGPMHESLGWSVTEISLAITVYGLAAAMMAPLVGAIADRGSVRTVALWSLLLFGLSFGSLALTPPTVWAWWTAWGLAGLVGVGSGSLTWTRGIGLWFLRQRGLALGIALIGTSFTGVLVPQLAGWAIDRFGWRSAFPLLAALPLGVALPIVWLWFREPPPGDRPAGVFAADRPLGLATGEAVRSYRFWIMIASILLIALAYGGMFVHMQQIVELAGFPRAAARGVVSSMAIAILVGRIGTGWFLDRFWAPLVTLPILSLPALACLLLAGDGLTLPVAYFCALTVGLAAGAETDLIAYMGSRYFGMANYGRIYGLLFLPFGIASAVSPAIYGWARDATGGYDLALHVATGMFIVGAALPLALGRYPVFNAAGGQGARTLD